VSITIRQIATEAECPGVAMAALDRHLGVECSLFLQGTGADAKAGPTSDGVRWTNSPWEKVVRMGESVAQEVIGRLEQGLEPVEPELRCGEVELQWPVQTPLDRAGFQALLDDPATDELHCLWVQAQLARLDRGQTLPTAVPVTLHGIQLGGGVRLVALEGEAVAEWGLMFRDHFAGVTFPLGYTDGAQLYLVTSHMLDEGGYEAESYYLFGQPAPLARSMEGIVQAGWSNWGGPGCARPIPRWLWPRGVGLPIPTPDPAVSPSPRPGYPPCRRPGSPAARPGPSCSSASGQAAWLARPSAEPWPAS
jgi:hypothetical protein